MPDPRELRGVDAATLRRRPPPPATILQGGRRIPLGADGLTVGRADDNDVVIARESVSRNHARVVGGPDGYAVADLRSTNGIQLNGERFRGESRWLVNGDTFVIGGEPLRFLSGSETTIGTRPDMPGPETRLIQFAGDSLSIGRDPSNDVVLDDPNVSRFHAAVVRADGRVELRDLGSRNGTRLDGQLVRRTLLTTGSQIGVGPYRLIFDGASFVARAERGALRLDAERVGMEVRGKRILAETSFSVQPGEFVAVIGESGSGKTTLLKALAGVVAPTDGVVTVNGEEVTTRLTDIGYLPQDEIVHGKLTVLEALTYSARLRLPRDTGEDEIAETVDRVLAELELQNHAHTRIELLSGGQRKRVGVAAELLNRPSLLFLDEPTTGLDPGLETRMMSLLRDLTAGGSRAVLVVTHATKNLGLCDKLVVMGRGGHLCFLGAPGEALAFFGADTFDDVYSALDRRDPLEWQSEFLELTARRPVVGERDAVGAFHPTPRGAFKGGSALAQTWTLTHRYTRVFLRDRRNIVILFAQVPVLGVAIAGLFSQGAFRKVGGDAGNAGTLLFFVVTVAIWIGSIDAAREIIKERSVVIREAAAGVKVSAYLTSKLILLFALAALQTILLGAVAFAFQPLHESADGYVQVFAVLVLTSFAAVAMGLTMSAAVRTQDQATSFIPLVLIPQLFFGGAIVAVATMSEPIKSLSKLVLAEWSYAGIGSAIDMNARISADRSYAKVSRFGHDFFAVSMTTTYIALAAFLIVCTLGAALLLRRDIRH